MHVLGGQHHFAPLEQPGEELIIGPYACAPCLGVTLIPVSNTPTTRDPAPIVAFHFLPTDNASNTLSQYAWLTELNDYTAVLNGHQAQADPNSQAINNVILADVIDTLTSLGVDMTAYIPASSIGVDTDGTIYNVAPGDPADGYDPSIDIYPQ